MTLHQLPPRMAVSDAPWDRDQGPEAELQEARSILRRLLRAEDRIGLVHPVIDDARRWLARTNRG